VAQLEALKVMAARESMWREHSTADSLGIALAIAGRTG
jgi:hypothetical protein